MLNSIEYANQHLNDPAVLCYKRVAGTILTYSDFEDPAIFSDLVSSGILEYDGAITIGEALGTKLVKDLDSLTPILPDCIEKIPQKEISDIKKEEKLNDNDKQNQNQNQNDEILNIPQIIGGGVVKGKIKIHIGEGRGIDLEIPVEIPNNSVVLENEIKSDENKDNEIKSVENKNKEIRNLECIKNENKYIEIEEYENIEKENKENLIEKNEEVGITPVELKGTIRSFVRKMYDIIEVQRGNVTKIENNVLYIRDDIEYDLLNINDSIKDIKIDVLNINNYHIDSAGIIDIRPVVMKKNNDEKGEGISYVLNNVMFCITGITDTGMNIDKYNKGYLDEIINWDAFSCPSVGNVIIKISPVFENGKEGKLINYIVNSIIDNIMNDISKSLNDNIAWVDELIKYERHPNKKKIAVVKIDEDDGTDFKIPILCSPLDIVDNSSYCFNKNDVVLSKKSNYYFNDPMIMELLKEEEVDFVTVVVANCFKDALRTNFSLKNLFNICESIDVDAIIIDDNNMGNIQKDIIDYFEKKALRDIKIVSISSSLTENDNDEQNIYGKYELGKDDIIKILNAIKFLLQNNKIDDLVNNDTFLQNMDVKYKTENAIQILKRN